MKKRISLTSNIILFCIIIGCIIGINAMAETNLPDVEVPDYTEEEYIEDIEFTKEELEVLIEDCQLKMEAAHMMANQARILGYAEDCGIIEIARIHWWHYHDMKFVYKEKLDKLIEEEMNAPKYRHFQEYPEAATVWYYFKDKGYNDYVCAGIIGNMMCECGGLTLNLQPMAYSPGKYFYGLCQWSKPYYSNIFDADIDEQLDFLYETIDDEFNIFGYAYRSGFNYEKFLLLENEKDVALAFAKCYERCASEYYSVRQTCATRAYNYFTN